MKNDHLITPAEFVKNGSVSAQEMQQLIENLRITKEDLAKAFPNANLQLDSDFILRVEASADDAAEVDHILQESLTAFTPFSITVRQ